MKHIVEYRLIEERRAGVVESLVNEFIGQSDDWILNGPLMIRNVDGVEVFVQSIARIKGDENE